MDHRIFAAIVTLALMTVTLPGVLGQEAAPRDPVVNGELEFNSPVGSALAGTPADECIGIGHQVLFGSQSPQGQIAGGPYDDPDPQNSDPQGAASGVAGSPVEQALLASGYGYCVFGDEDGYDLCWCNPARLVADEALHWSGHDDDIVDDVDLDGDREIKISKDGNGHNIWQAWPSPHQAYSANFDALEVRVESGEIADNARVVVSMSATPLQAQSPWVGYFYDCQLRFSADQFQPGANAISPVEGAFTAASADCEDAAEDWEDADETERREILGRLRIGQLSFWGWQNVDSADDEVVLDGIGLPGATVPAEELANGNVNPNPTDETTGRE